MRSDLASCRALVYVINSHAARERISFYGIRRSPQLEPDGPAISVRIPEKNATERPPGKGRSSASKPRRDDALSPNRLS